jgi:hypothetical protein
MSKSVAKIVGIVLLAAGVGIAILHYVMEGNVLNSWLTLGAAAALLIAGWALFDWGSGFSHRRGPGEE